MINDELYVKILEAGLTLDHYYLLQSIKSKVKLVTNKRIQGFINLLNKKGYLKDEELTKLGLELVKEPVSENWIEEIFIKCENKILELTGEKQVRPKIENKAFSFMPNIVDFTRTLSKVVILYKLKDKIKIENALIAHIEECNNSKNWFPLMQYFILKNNSSPLVTALNNVQEKKEINEKLINTKNLFHG